jgi:hypothetical protein
MKLRYLVLIAIGVFIGIRIASKMREDDPNVVTGPQRDAGTNANQAARIVSTQAQRLADQAAGLSLEAIRKARGAIQARLADNGSDAAWN